MPTKLTEMDLDFVSTVDRGANQKRFAVLKVDGPGAFPPVAATEDERTESVVKRVLSQVLDAILGKTSDAGEVSKARTFAEIVAGEELNDAFTESWTTLQDALWSAMYAYGADNQPLPLDQKKALVAQSLDEYKAYLLAAMDTGVSKSDAGTAVSQSINGLVSKVGRKISGARLTALKEAADKLLAVLADVEASDAETEKRAQPEEEDMTGEEFAAAVEAAVTKANAPLIERITKLEGAAPQVPAASESVDKTEGAPAAGDATMADVVAAIGKLADRIDGIEKARGERQSQAGQDQTGVKKGAGQFSGMFTQA